MLLYLTVAFCAFLAAILVYRYDLYEREPWLMLLLAAGLGVLVMRFLGEIEMILLRQVAASLSSAAAVAAVVEELARLGTVVAIALLFRREFNDPMDGIIYGSIVGLGMGLEESFHVIGQFRQPSFFLSFPVELVRLLGHLIMGGITGFGVGMARMRIPHWPARLVGSVAFAAVLHFSWDWMALAAPTAQVMTWPQTPDVDIIIVSGMLFYGMLVVVGSDWSKRHFAPHSQATLWGWPFNLLRKRRRAD